MPSSWMAFVDNPFVSIELLLFLTDVFCMVISERLFTVT